VLLQFAQAASQSMADPKPEAVLSAEAAARTDDA